MEWQPLRGMEIQERHKERWAAWGWTTPSPSPLGPQPSATPPAPSPDPVEPTFADRVQSVQQVQVRAQVAAWVSMHKGEALRHCRAPWWSTEVEVAMFCSSQRTTRWGVQRSLELAIDRQAPPYYKLQEVINWQWFCHTQRIGLRRGERSVWQLQAQLVLRVPGGHYAAHLVRGLGHAGRGVGHEPRSMP